MKTSPIVAAINADELAWTQSDRTTEKGIHGAYFGVQVGESIWAVLSNRDLTISSPSNQFVETISRCDV